MRNKINFIIIIIITIAVLATLINIDVKLNRPATIVDVENHYSYNAIVKKNAIILNRVNYFINMKELVKNIKDSKTLDESSSIVSSIILYDGIYHKYDIFKSGNETYIIFYKFKNEDCVEYDCPAFKLKDIENLIRTKTKYMKDLD